MTEYQNKVLEATLAQSESILEFFGDNRPEEIQNTIKKTLKITEKTSKDIDNVTASLDNSTNLVKQKSKELKSSLNQDADFNINLDNLTKTHIISAGYLIENTVNNLVQNNFASALENLNIKTKRLDKKPTNLKLEQNFVNLNNAATNIYKWSENIENTFSINNINKVKDNTDKFKKSTKNL